MPTPRAGLESEGPLLTRLDVGGFALEYEGRITASGRLQQCPVRCLAVNDLAKPPPERDIVCPEACGAIDVARCHRFVLGSSRFSYCNAIHCGWRFLHVDGRGLLRDAGAGTGNCDDEQGRE